MRNDGEIEGDVDGDGDVVDVLSAKSWSREGKVPESFRVDLRRCDFLQLQLIKSRYCSSTMLNLIPQNARGRRVLLSSIRADFPLHESLHHPLLVISEDGDSFQADFLR